MNVKYIFVIIGMLSSLLVIIVFVEKILIPKQKLTECQDALWPYRIEGYQTIVSEIKELEQDKTSWGLAVPSEENLFSFALTL